MIRAGELCFLGEHLKPNNIDTSFFVSHTNHFLTLDTYNEWISAETYSERCQTSSKMGAFCGHS